MTTGEVAAHFADAYGAEVFDDATFVKKGGTGDVCILVRDGLKGPADHPNL
ncbi:hypothetical protein MOKP106_45690 [Mycobacterium avium subsp. hominissuis]|nr:hypothetical protein L837_5161 [Mycobacterium avium MAV_061107_1842]KDP01402.1 hypothetical protein MAV3388_06260 [Mycobacterium avium subsp. hominissuis 3388]